MGILRISKKSQRLFIWIGVLVLGIFLFYKLATMFAPGSYAFSETYVFKVSEKELIRAIDEFRNENPQYYVPFDVTSIEGRHGDLDYWYHFYFYYHDENQILHCWVRGGTKQTTFAFVGVNDGLSFGHWKTVNDDFGFFENRKVIKQFEERILNHIKEQVRTDTTITG
jgi:hypothetical protein